MTSMDLRHDFVFVDKFNCTCIRSYAHDWQEARSPKIVGPSLALLLSVDVSPTSEFRRWPNQYGCVGRHGRACRL